MLHPKSENFLAKKLRHIRRPKALVALLVVVVIAGFGVHVLGSSHAATPYVSSEATSGTLIGLATIQPSSTAFEGSDVQFDASPIVSSPISGVPAGITPGSAFENEFAGMTPTQQLATTALMKSDGVKWLRIDIYNLPPSYSPLIKDAIADGIQIDAILQDQTLSTVASVATQEVSYLKADGVETYEILNEPNGCEDTMDAADYTAILKASYTAIKAADPHAFVLTAGLCPSAGSNEPYTYLTAMYADGAAGYFDAFNMHPYSFPDTPDQTTDSWNPWSYLPQLHSIMAANGDGNKQIWLTEFGCPTPTPGTVNDCTDATEAQQITDAFSSARALPWVGPLLIFSWEDSSDGDFGLYTATGAAKPLTLAAYQAAAND